MQTALHDLRLSLLWVVYPGANAYLSRKYRWVRASLNFKIGPPGSVKGVDFIDRLPVRTE